MRPVGPLVLLAIAVLFHGCSTEADEFHRSEVTRSPMFDSARYEAVALRLRDAFVLHDTVYCDSVLPLFDDTALARLHPERVVDGFVSNLIGHEAPQPTIWARFNALVAYSGAPVMRNWRDYVAVRELQNTGTRQQAIAALEPLLAEFERDSDEVGIASVSKRIGHLYLELGEPAIAAGHLSRARPLEPRVDIRSTITATLGRCYALLGRVDSMRWCARTLIDESANELNAQRRDSRAAVNARWLLHLAALSEPSTDSLRLALRSAQEVDTLIEGFGPEDGFLVSGEPAARIETHVLRAKACMLLGSLSEAIRILDGAKETLARCPDCLPQRLAFLSVRADVFAERGDLRAALRDQQDRSEVLALNEVGRERLSVEQARAKAERAQLEADARKLLDIERSSARASDAEHRMQRVNLMTMIGFIILFAGVLFAHTRIRRRIQLEGLRTRLSRDLHDDIGSTLSSINILSTVARRKAEAGDEAGAAASLSGISERTQRLMRNMSDIVWSVDPAQDSMADLLARMREFGAAVLEPKGIGFRFVSGDDLPMALSAEMKSNLYLTFKEAVNNAAKHANASRVEVAVVRKEGSLRMTITDNGTGIVVEGAAPDGGGNGLRNMRARAAEMKAELEVRSAPHKGTTVDLTVRL